MWLVDVEMKNRLNSYDLSVTERKEIDALNPHSP